MKRPIDRSAANDQDVRHRADIAAMDGITRSTANRLLHQAENDGIIAISHHRITVSDADALRRRAGAR